MAVGGPGTGSFGNALPVTPTGIRDQRCDPDCVDSKLLEDRVWFGTQGQVRGVQSTLAFHTGCLLTVRALGGRQGRAFPPTPCPRQPSPDRILNLPTPPTPVAGRAEFGKAWLWGGEPKETGATSSLLLQLPGGARAHRGPSPTPLHPGNSPQCPLSRHAAPSAGRLNHFSPGTPRVKSGPETTSSHHLRPPPPNTHTRNLARSKQGGLFWVSSGSPYSRTGNTCSQSQMALRPFLPLHLFLLMSLGHM